MHGRIISRRRSEPNSTAASGTRADMPTRLHHAATSSSRRTEGALPAPFEYPHACRQRLSGRPTTPGEYVPATSRPPAWLAAVEVEHAGPPALRLGCRVPLLERLGSLTEAPPRAPALAC